MFERARTATTALATAVSKAFSSRPRRLERRVVDAAGEASRFVERFAGDVSSARWSRSRLACASTWILSLRISSRASLRLVCGLREESGEER